MICRKCRKAARVAVAGHPVVALSLHARCEFRDCCCQHELPVADPRGGVIGKFQGDAVPIRTTPAASDADRKAALSALARRKPSHAGGGHA